GSGTEVNEKLIDSVLNESFDVKKEAAEYVKLQERKRKYEDLFENFQKATAAKEWSKAGELLNEMEKYTEERDMADLELTRLKLNLKQQDLAAAEATVKRM